MTKLLSQPIRVLIGSPMLAVGITACAALPNAVLADDVIEAEQKLLSGMQAIQGLALDKAIFELNELSEDYPKYKLAQMMKADLLAIKSGQKPMLDKIRQQNPKTVATLESEAKVRWDFAQKSLEDNPGLEKYILKSGNQKYTLLVDLHGKRLYLYERQASGELKSVADYYITIGAKGGGKQKEGDRRTPVGVYHVVDFITQDRLPDFYGTGALPINYPNQWDRSLGKTGSGIWLHGVPSTTYARAPNASRGCVVLNNKAMTRLMEDFKLPLSTPIVIWDEDQSVFSFGDEKQQLVAEVRGWIEDNRPSVKWDEVNIFRYPSEDGLYYATYPASKQGDMMHQFWKRDAEGGWAVLFEKEEPREIKYVFK